MAGSANFELPASPAVSGLSVAHTKKRVTAHFRLDGRATVTVQVRRLAKGQAGRPLNQVSRKLARGPRRITLPARKDGGALRKGIYRVRVRAETTGGERSVPRIADFRVK